MNERRKDLRVNNSVMVRYWIGDGFLKTGSRSADMSTGGVRLPLHQKLEPGTKVELSIEIENNAKPLIASGQVAWVERKKHPQYPFEIGIKFTRIDSGTLERLKKYLESLPPDDSAPKMRWLDKE
ncbi:MAG TPA: PilZ domain-containing protein [Candidatus Omnitrophota bacterium]|nr:PilZ domain-containing protein [Candidatus Omnitrophota bacterium]HRZ14964.1 PilZ domain-containing protein [Candidatus Omnitrophota bacterium]